jgi:hypothetical protein
MRYQLKIYTADTDGDYIVIDDGDIMVAYDETLKKILVLKPIRKR